MNKELFLFFPQTDVSGTCDVSYKLESTSWGTKTIKKTKDLLTCTGRHSADTILQAVHYDVPSVSLFKTLELQIIKFNNSSHTMFPITYNGNVSVDTTCVLLLFC